MIKFTFVGLSMMLALSNSGLSAVFGDDNRLDIHQTSYQHLNSSVLAMIPNRNIKASDLSDQELHINAPRIATYLGKPFCDDMKFVQQPSLADCSGFYLGDGLLMTAGHCVADESGEVRNIKTKKCASNTWVIGYQQDNLSESGELAINSSQAYQCDEVVSASYTSALDYAIIRLKGDLEQLKAVQLNPGQNLDRGVEVIMAGYPSGLPLKMTDHASIYYSSPSASYFKTDLDAFFGNSGSPVFNEQLEVIGILTAGEIDYVVDENRGCARVNICKGVGRLCDLYSGQYGALGSVVTKINNVLMHSKIFK